MDDDLRNCLWNVLVGGYFVNPGNRYSINYSDKEQQLTAEIWAHFFKRRVDQLPRDWDDAVKFIRDWFARAAWHEVYDFLEFLARQRNLSRFWNADLLSNALNGVLQQEASGYRFLNGLIQPITNPTEMDEVKEASALDGPFAQVSKHIDKALEHLSDRISPDYANSFKEAILAVEAACSIIAGKKTTLPAALDLLEKQGVRLHPAFRQALEKLYAYAGDEQGVRHAAVDKSLVDFNDAKFMLVCCSAFVNLLVSRKAI